MRRGIGRDEGLGAPRSSLCVSVTLHIIYVWINGLIKSRLKYETNADDGLRMIYELYAGETETEMGSLRSRQKRHCCIMCHLR